MQKEVIGREKLPYRGAFMVGIEQQTSSLNICAISKYILD
jgi:hypothetical protein